MGALYNHLSSHALNFAQRSCSVYAVNDQMGHRLLIAPVDVLKYYVDMLVQLLITISPEL